jgi:hypothetical protein
MMLKGADRGPHRFVPVEMSGLRDWRRPADSRWIELDGLLPVADTELLNLSHHCPIAIRLADGIPAVVCLLDAHHLRAPRFGADGRWIAPYAPIALRALPFRVRIEPEGRRVEVSVALARAESDGPAYPLLDDAGRPGRDYAAILSMLDALAKGSARLADAARLLIAADLLVPLAPRDERSGPALLTVGRERLLGLSPDRAAALAMDACLPLDLAAAAIFSQRWLADGLLRDAPPAPAAATRDRPDLLDHGLRDAIDQPFSLDGEALFDFEAFARARRADERA